MKTSSDSVLFEEIQLLAYQLWEQSSRPSGRDMEFWLEAQRQLEKTPQPSKKTAPKTGKKRATAAPGKLNVARKSSAVAAAATSKPPAKSRKPAPRRSGTKGSLSHPPHQKPAQ
jgi:hypothetical protein